MPKYEIEHMEHGGWVVEAPSILDAVMQTVDEHEEAVLERVTVKSTWFAIYNLDGENIDHWMVRPLADDEAKP